MIAESQSIEGRKLEVQEKFFNIETTEILPWVRKSYLTHAILPRLSREG